MSDSATLSFTTVCANASVPFGEAFTGFGLPACWNTLAGNVFYNWAETAENGEGYVYSYAGSGSPANDWIMTPVIDIPADAAASNICLVYAIGGDGIINQEITLDNRFKAYAVTLGPFELKAGSTNTHEFEVPQCSGALRFGG